MPDNYKLRDANLDPIIMAAKALPSGTLLPQSTPTDSAGNPFGTGNPLPVAASRAAVAMSGSRIVTTTNPQRLLASNAARKTWRVFNLSAQVATLGYDNDPTHAAIPLALDGVALAGYVADEPVEANEIWYHGPIGSVLGVVEG